MITDFLQGQFLNLVFLVIMFVLFAKLGWSNIVDTLKAAPVEKSMLNPFKQGDIPDFNIWFFVMIAFLHCYGYMSWPGSQGYYCSARSPHEAKMARIIAMWRWGVFWLMVMMIPICVYVVLNSGVLASDAIVYTVAAVDKYLQMHRYCLASLTMKGVRVLCSMFFGYMVI